MVIYIVDKNNQKSEWNWTS